MFGLSRRERFEKKVRLHISVLSMAGYAPSPDAAVESSVLHYLADHWEILISEALNKKRSPQKTAFVLYHLVLTHKVLITLDTEELSVIKGCIENREFDADKYNSSLARILYFVFAGNSYCASEEMEWDILLSAIWDIHNAIFSDRTSGIHTHDSELNENAHKNTRDYLIEASYALYKDMAIP